MPSPDPSSRAEHELLIQCARKATSGGEAVPIESAVLPEFDWEYFLDQVDHHRITPLVYESLSSSLDTIPENVLETLETRTQGITHRALEVTWTLTRLFEIFEEHEIRAFPYKGPSLRAAVHDDIAFRGSADLDILLPREAILRARDVLLSGGFQPRFEWGESELHRRVEESRHTSVVSENDVIVEMHWRPEAGHTAFPVDFEELWADREFIEIGGGTLPMLPPSEHVILLAVHGTRHCWHRLAWLCDFAGAIKTFDLDWKQVLQSALQRGGKRKVLLGCYLSGELLDVELPSVVGDEIEADASIARDAVQVTERFLWVGEVEPLASLRFRIRLGDGVRNQIRLVLRLGFKPKQADFEALPSTLRWYPLAVAVRPIRVLGTTARLVVERRKNGE